MLRRIDSRCCPILNNLENKYCDAAVGGSTQVMRMSETYTLRERSEASSQRKGGGVNSVLLTRYYSLSNHL